MNIAIDCRSLRKKPAGIANFLIGVINHLAIEKKSWKLFLLSNQEFSNEAEKKLCQAPNLIKVIEPLPIFSNIATVWYVSKVPRILDRLNVDLYYCPIPNLPWFIPRRIKTMITVHDMVYKRFARTMSVGNRLINFFLHDFSINNAQKIWAVSVYTKTEIEKFFPHRRCKDILVGTSIDKSVFFPLKINASEEKQILERYKITSPFILTVGTLEPRKNLRFLLSLLPGLATQNLELLIIGEKGWGNAKGNIVNLPDFIRNKVRFGGFVPDEDLAKLYQLASVYVSTSLNEGFCLPLLEAMQCGCPVVAAHNSAMIEVVADGGATVEGWNKDAWIKAINEVIKDRNRYVVKGFEKAKTFEWDEVIPRMIRYLDER